MGDVVRAAAWDVAVAWCLKVGGAVAIAFAFARLAAIAAATLLFLGTGVLELVDVFVMSSGSGHAFSSCLRAVLSRLFIMTVLLSRHTLSNAQKAARATSLVPGLGSARPFLRHFSRVSTPPALSIVCLERAP